MAEDLRGIRCVVNAGSGVECPRVENEVLLDQTKPIDVFTSRDVRPTSSRERNLPTQAGEAIEEARKYAGDAET